MLGDSVVVTSDKPVFWTIELRNRNEELAQRDLHKERMSEEPQYRERCLKISSRIYNSKTVGLPDAGQTAEFRIYSL